MRSARLVNREQLYVSASRARMDVRNYTDDAEALRRAVTGPEERNCLGRGQAAANSAAAVPSSIALDDNLKPRERKHWHNLYVKTRTLTDS
jgi:hypothetical protein